MKNQSNKILRGTILLLVGSLAMFSCSDNLDVVPKDQVTDAILWSSPENADLFLNNVYAAVPSLPTNDPWENYSDNSMHGQNGSYSLNVYAASQYTPSNGPSKWGHYGNIRRCNLFIENVTSSSLPDDWKEVRLAEARFLRAYYYYILWSHHGGVPIIANVLNLSAQGDEIFRPRNSAQETFEFITSELEAIANDLPLEAAAGRATRGAALTLKGVCELFNASPLYNTADDASRWAQAAATFKRVMDSESYELFDDYETLFYEDNNNNVEVIWARQHLGGTDLANFSNGEIGPRFVNGSLTAFGHVNPTQEIVDEYVMANGLPITDPASGYDPENPYADREKRFYQSIVYDGSIWMGDEMVMKQGVGSPNATDLSNSGTSTRTGYYLRKGVNPEYAIAFNNQNSADWIIFRYAEVLLSYAEAQNEAVGPDASVHAAVNAVRDRSDLDELALDLTKDEMREAIHRERRVELAFEEKRLLDLFRLKLAETNLNGPLHAVRIEQEGGDWVYNVVPAAGGMRVFDPEKNYLLPVPQSARDVNSKLSQNPHY